jgi:DNA-binding XRE family transcriptional regulator
MLRGRIQAVFYRDANGREPVDIFLEELLKAQPLAAAKIDDAIEEHLNGRQPDEPPPEFRLPRRSTESYASCGFGLRALATGCSISDLATWLSCSTPSRRTQALCRRVTVRRPRGAWPTFGRGWTRSVVVLRGRLAGMLRRSRGEADRFTIRDKLWLVSDTVRSPVGRPAVETAGGRADRSEAYRDARAEYARIRALREVSPIAAHLRERRFELALTQAEVAKAAGTSHSAVSRLEKGTHIPQLPTLQRIAAVLDEELLVCFQRTVDGEVEREFAAVA